MTPFFQLLWIFALLASVIFSARTMEAFAHRRIGIAGMITGFASSVFLLRTGNIPDVPLVGTVVAVIAGWELMCPDPTSLRHSLLSGITGGALAGLAGALGHMLGFPLWVTLAFAVLLTVIVAALSWRNTGFVDGSMLEEAFAGILVSGVLLGLAPGAIVGWQSAVALNADLAGKSNVSPLGATLPIWTLLLTATTFAAGGAFSVWKRRIFKRRNSA